MKIGLVGKMRSGKDTVADYLKDEYKFNSFAFSNGITHIIKDYFPKAFNGGKPRHHYQHIGQSLRALDEYVWINYLLDSVKRFENFYAGEVTQRLNIVVTDVRQVNEVTTLKERGYLIVKVTCSEDTRIERMKKLGDIVSTQNLNHSTEQQVDQVMFDVEIINDGTLEDLYSKVDKLMEEYGGVNYESN